MPRKNGIKMFSVTRKKLFASLILIGLILGLAYALNLGPFSNDSKEQKTVAELTERGINLNPATEQEKTESERHKDELAQQNSEDSNPTTNVPATNTNKKQVTPLITRVDQTEIRAYVPGIVESGGVCTATLSKGASVITKTSDALANATVTNCKPINLSDTQFPQTGQWKLIVSYNSSSAAGESEQTTLEVR